MGSAAATVSQLSQRRPGLTVSTSRGLLTIWEWWRTPTSAVEGWDSQGLLFAVSNTCKDGKFAIYSAAMFNVPVGHVWPNMIAIVETATTAHRKGRCDEKRSNRPWFVLKKVPRSQPLGVAINRISFLKKNFLLHSQLRPIHAQLPLWRVRGHTGGEARKSSECCSETLWMFFQVLFSLPSSLAQNPH